MRVLVQLHIIENKKPVINDPAIARGGRGAGGRTHALLAFVI